MPYQTILLNLNDEPQHVRVVDRRRPDDDPARVPHAPGRGVEEGGRREDP